MAEEGAHGSRTTCQRSEEIALKKMWYGYKEIPESKAMDRASEDGFHASSQGDIYEECGNNRKNACIEEGFAERAGFRLADAYLLY